MYPCIYLAIDNIFASKRWTKPDEWCELIARLGVKCIEASADTELDPLFMGEEYLRGWIKEVKKAESAGGVKVVNCYSGHGTYTTLGLTHTDSKIRKRMIEQWFKPLIRTAAELGSGLGFFTHAFPHSALQDRLEYEKYINILEDALCEINNFAGECGCGKIGVEQMYTPHQYPWKRKQLRTLLRNIKAKSGRDFYFTEDVGHHLKIFQKPGIDILEKADGFIKKEIIRSNWFGSDNAYALAEKGMVRELQEELEKTDHLFSDRGDESCYSWISEFGCYSPIIHLQQTDGNTSSHYPFTNERNSWGIIEGHKLLEALKAAYDRPDEKDMPERCNEVYLTLELFIGTASITCNSLEDIKESVSYWRTIIPKDGVPLDKLTG